MVSDPIILSHIPVGLIVGILSLCLFFLNRTRIILLCYVAACVLLKEKTVCLRYFPGLLRIIYIYFYQVLCMGLMFLIDTTFAVVCHLSASIEGL